MVCQELQRVLHILDEWRQDAPSRYRKAKNDICARNNIKNDRVLNILIKKMAESVKQPLSFNRLKNEVTGDRYLTASDDG